MFSAEDVLTAVDFKYPSGTSMYYSFTRQNTFRK